MPRIFLLLIIATLLSACAAGGGQRAHSDLAAMAESMASEGELARAAQTFIDASNESRADRDFYRLRAAEAWREAGEPEMARQAASDINERRLSDSERLRLRLLLAEVALDARDAARARELLEGLSAGGAHRAYRPRLLELRGRAWQRKDPFYAARIFAELGESLEGKERSDNAKRIRALLAGMRDNPLRDSAAGLTASDPLRPFVTRALTSRGFSVPPQLQRPAGAEPQALPEAGAQQRIALLLPLSGPLQAVGSAVRDGFLSARMADAGSATEVDVVDSGDTPAAAIAAYRRAVAGGADLVVGPLTREAVGALFSEDDLPVPVLALNRSPVAMPFGQTSFALAPEEEGAAIAARMQQRELARVVAVVSADDSAQRALSGMQQRLQATGGSLLSTITLDERAIDFQDAIRAGLESAGLPTALPEDPNEPHDPGFDAVFIAVRAPAARLLVPQLKLFGLAEVPMLGTSIIHSAADEVRFDRELSGVEFCDSPWLIEDLPGLPARSVVAAQLDSLRGPAARLFAFGMDAWRLLPLRSTRDSSQIVAGATGMLGFDEFGESQREPAIAVFRNGRPRRVVDGTLIPDGGPQG